MTSSSSVPIELCLFYCFYLFILFYFVVVFFIVCCAYLFILILYDLAKGRCKRIHLYFSAKNRSCVLAIDIHEILSLVQPSHNTSLQANHFTLLKARFSFVFFFFCCCCVVVVGYFEKKEKERKGKKGKKEKKEREEREKEENKTNFWMVEHLSIEWSPLRQTSTTTVEIFWVAAVS